MTIHDVETMLPSIVQLCWMALIGIVIWRFGQPLSEALGRLRRGKVAGVEVELEAANKELSKLVTVQSFSLAQNVPAMSASASVSQMATSADTDEFQDFVTVLLDQASRAPEAAVIHLRVELENVMREFNSKANAPRLAEVITQKYGAADLEQWNAVILSQQDAIPLYLEMSSRLLALPASREHIRALMFQYIDRGISLLDMSYRLCAWIDAFLGQSSPAA